MSHTVTITRTTTTTTSAIIVNTGYFKTWPGILKFFELVGAALLSLFLPIFLAHPLGTSSELLDCSDETSTESTTMTRFQPGNQEYSVTDNRILGIVNVGLVSYHFKDRYYYNAETMLFLLMSTTFMIGTFLLLTSCLLSISTASIMPKTIHEFVYHLFAFLMILISSAVFISEIHRSQELLFAAAIIGFVLSALYLASAIFGYRTYKGM